MIQESCYWKEPLLKAAEWLECLIISENEELEVRVEREIFIGFYSIRKLLDTFKISHSTRAFLVTLQSHRCKKNVDYLNCHRLDELYDLSKQIKETRPLRFVCDQFIHSFVFGFCMEQDNKLAGFFIASDKLRSERLFFLPIQEILRIFRTVGEDYPTDMHMRRNPITKQWEEVVEEDNMHCGCGCGEETKGKFRPGHDQKLRARLEKKTGGLKNLERLVEKAEGVAEGSQPIGSLETLVQDIFKIPQAK